MKNTIQLLRGALSPLYDAGEARAIVRLLLEEVCGLSYADILLHADDLLLPPAQSELLRQYAVRLAQGEPVQQVLGYTWFRGRKFAVNREVLTPRPETAELVQMVVDNFRGSVENPLDNAANPVDNRVEKLINNPVENSVENLVEHPVENPLKTAPLRLMDIGTGSGCIALSLAAEIHHSFITAIDLSTAALTTARQNAAALNISNIEFVQLDILQAAAQLANTDINRLSTYDAVVSNPPYICRKEAAAMAPNVLNYEPDMALFVPDTDPLLFYRAIGSYAQGCLKPGGKLFFEINEAFGQATCQLLSAQGYQQVQLHRDFYGKDRFVTAIKS